MSHTDPVAATALFLAVVLVSPSIYSAVVAMVIVTTMVTPPALTWSLARRRRAPDQSPP